MFGDFDWEELRKVGRLDAFLWFIPFIVLIVLILLNMLIAIVMDAYEEVITGLDHEDNIWVMTEKAYYMKMQKWKKEDIPLSEVLRFMNQKIKEEERKRKEVEEDQGGGDDIDSDTSDENAKQRIKGRFLKKFKKLAADRNKRKEPNVTISLLKEIFRDKGIRTTQCEKLIRDSVMHYYAANKEVGDINEVLTAIARID